MRYREILEACWKGYRKDGMKTMFGKRYPNCVKNKKKSNESITDITEEQLEENLRDWFGKGKDGGAGGGGWDRYNTKGERIGKCGDRKPGEGKPKCLSKSKAASLRSSGGKKKIATAVRRKKSADKNPERKGKAKNVSSAAESVMEAAVTKLIPYTPEEIRNYNRWAERNGQSDYNPQHLFRGSVGDKMMFVGKGTPIPVEVIGLDQSLPTAVTVRALDGSNKELDMDWINYRDQVQLRPMTPQEQSMHANELHGELAETNKSDSRKQNFDTANIWASNFIAHGQEMREILDIPNDSTVYFGDLPEVVQNEVERQIDGQVEDGERVTIRQRGRNIRDTRVIVEVPHLDAIDETTMTQAASRSSTSTSKTSKKLNWNNIPNHLTVDERSEIFEQYVLSGNLKESNNERAQESFDRLFGMSDKLIKNNDYFVVPLMLINNRLLSIDRPQYLKFIRKETNELIFYSDNSEKKYPYNLIRDISSYHVFAFENSNSYDKFRTVVALKFDYNLPDFKFGSSSDIDETTMTQAASRSVGPKFGGYYGATQKGAPKKNQGFGASE